jgi:hypothetical protein
MATRAGQSTETVRTGAIHWPAGIAGGVLGTAVFTTLQFALGATGSVAMAIPAMYGIAGPAMGVGVAFHLFHGSVLGVLYAGLVSVPRLRGHAATLRGGSILGVAYGVLTTVAFAAIVMPVWLSTVGFPTAPPLPDLSVPSLVFHVAYGVVLGTTYPVLSRRL